MSEAASSKPASKFTGTQAVAEQHRFDEAALAEWMQTNVAGFEGPLTVLQFKGGQSNPTYRLETPRRSYVLRRKPFGTLLPSAHAVDREFRLLAGLASTDVPVASVYALCEDPSVIGAIFYIMQAVEGPIYWNGALPEVPKQERRPMYESLVTTLAQLHSVDFEAVGLGDYGRPGNYFARQVERWTRQYRASEAPGEVNPTAEKLIEFLARTVPAQERISIVHGDYRLDNIIFSPPVAGSAGRVAAVVDWELSTLGDPLADFSYLLMCWLLPHNRDTSLHGLDLDELGIPSLDEMSALYCKLTHRATLPDLNWYFSYNLFRLLGIVQGIAGRIRQGTAASAQARETAARAPALAEASWHFAKKAGA